LDAAWHLFGPDVNRAGIPRLLAHPSSYLLVAFSDEEDELGDAGTPLGVLLGSEVTGADLATEMFITFIGVRPMAQRLGVGSALIRSMLALARDRGCSRVRGTIAPENAGALRVMRKMGAAAENVSINVSWQLTGASEG
jgi:GNAT superfamily N-acetyltransferase